MANTIRLKALEGELSDENTLPVVILGSEYRILTRFKRLKFLRLITSDPAGALALVFPAEDMERLEEAVETPEDLSAVIEAVSEALVGDSKN
mgnify:CR=1 FL=1